MLEIQTSIVYAGHNVFSIGYLQPNKSQKVLQVLKVYYWSEHLDDSVDGMGHAIGGLDIGRDNCGLNSVGVGEGDGRAGGSGGDAGGDDLASDGLNGSSGDISGLNLGSNDVPQEDLRQGRDVGQEGLQGSLRQLVEGGVGGGENGEGSGWKMKNQH